MLEQKERIGTEIREPTVIGNAISTLASLDHLLSRLDSIVVHVLGENNVTALTGSAGGSPQTNPDGVLENLSRATTKAQSDIAAAHDMIARLEKSF